MAVQSITYLNTFCWGSVSTHCLPKIIWLGLIRTLCLWKSVPTTNPFTWQSCFTQLATRSQSWGVCGHPRFSGMFPDFKYWPPPRTAHCFLMLQSTLRHELLPYTLCSGRYVDGQSNVVADYGVVPLLGCLVRQSVAEVVTDFWLVRRQQCVWCWSCVWCWLCVWWLFGLVSVG